MRLSPRAGPGRRGISDPDGARPQGGVDFLQAARSGQREAPVELQAGLRSAGTRSLCSRTMTACQAQSALLDFLAHSAPDLSGFTPLVPAEGNPPPIRL